MKRIILIANLFVSIIIAQAQNATFDDVQVCSEICFGPIYKNEKLEGYYLFYQTSKSKGSSRFVLQLLDAQLNRTKETIITRPKKYSLLDFEYNGISFSALLKHKKEEHFVLFGSDGNEVSMSREASIVKIPIRDHILYVQRKNGMICKGLLAVKNVGFLKPSYFEKKWFWTSNQFINNNGHLVWDLNVEPENDNSFKGIIPIYCDSSRFITYFGTQKGVFSSVRTIRTEFRELSTGESLQPPVNTDLTQYKFIQDAVYNRYKSEYVLYGLYNKSKEGGLQVISPIMLDASEKTFFIQIYSRDGQFKYSKEVVWNREVDNAWNLFDKKKHNSTTEMCIHRVIPLSNGHYKIICELYSGELYRPQMVSPSTRVYPQELVVIDCDESLNVTHIEKIEKESKLKLTEKEAIFLNRLTMSSQVAPRLGWLDYSFDQFNPTTNELKVYYRNYNREDKPGKNDKYTVGMISTKDNQAAERHSFQLSSAPDWFNVYPASNGNVAIWEYNRKKESVTISIKAIE